MIAAGADESSDNHQGERPWTIIEAAAWKDTQVTGNARLTVWQAGSTPALHDETVTSMELVSSPARLNDGGVTGVCLPA